jgi:hypothetical protein
MIKAATATTAATPKARLNDDNVRTAPPEKRQFLRF